MLEVEINKILPLTEARDNFSKIVGEVEKGELYVLTKNGKPAVAIINVAKLEEMIGQHLKETSNIQSSTFKQKPTSNFQPNVQLPPSEPISSPQSSPPASVPPPKSSSFAPNPPLATPQPTPPGPPPLDSARGKPFGEQPNDKPKPTSPSASEEPEEMEI